jgi:cobalamin synthase
MRVVGEETEEDRKLREWFDEQANGNLDRLEGGAKTIIQLVTGLYGVLFVVLALSDQPTYLQNLGVRIGGTVSMIAFFVALVSAVLVVLPRCHTYQRDNLTDMKAVYQQMLGHKSLLLWMTLVSFLAGTASLGVVIGIVLWSP